MKTISLKAALLCAVAATPMMAVAQDSDFIIPDTSAGVIPERPADPYASEQYSDPAGEAEFYDPAPREEFMDPFMSEDRGGAATSSTTLIDSSRQALPPRGEEVSMAGYDEMLAGLNEDIDARLNQLSLGGEDPVAGALPDPEIGGYQSTLDQLSADQREIKLLESKLEKAKLAKEVWQELYTDDRDELAAQVAELEAANADLLSEARVQQEELLAQREADQARLMELEFELEMARAEAEAAAEAAATAAAAQPVLDEFDDNGGSQYNSGESGSRPGPISIPMPKNTPRVEAITIIGGRPSARLSMIEGNLRTVGVGDNLGAEHGTVVGIDARSGVQIKKADGTLETLERGTFRNMQTTAEFPDIDEDFGYMPDYLDDAAGFAN